MGAPVSKGMENALRLKRALQSEDLPFNKLRFALNRAPGFADLGAYSVAYVDLDEGFRMMTTIVGVEDQLTDIHIGQRVRVEFEKQDEGEYPIPVFRPV